MTQPCPTAASINYYNSVEEALGAGKAAYFMRLFMVPGMQHCGGGPGANSFGQFTPAGDADHDLSLALERWVEEGRMHRAETDCNKVRGR